MQKVRQVIATHKTHVSVVVVLAVLLLGIVISIVTTTTKPTVIAVPNISYESTVPSTGSKIFNGNGIAFDSSDNRFVVNRSNPTDIKKINSAGNLVTQWGSYGSGDGQFSLPHIVAVDNSDNVYVTDENFYVQKFDNDGNFIYKIGGYGTGDGQFSGLIYLAFDSSNNMYATGSNGSIQKFDTSGNFVSRIGSAGTGDGQFNSSGPYGIAIDSNDNIFAVDSSRVQKFDSSGTFVTKWGSSGCCGSGFFSSPRYIAIDSNDNVYVGQVSGQYMVQKFDNDGAYVAEVGEPTIFGIGDMAFDGADTLHLVTEPTSGTSYAQDILKLDTGLTTTGRIASDEDGQMILPNGIAVDSADNRYVVDTINSRIQKFDSSGNFVLNWSVVGVESALSGRITGITTDSSDNVYVALTSSSKIQKYTPGGVFVTEWGSAGSGDGQFTSIAGLATDSAGNIYAADRGGYRVQKFTSTGTYITKWGSIGTGNGQFGEPTGVAVDQSDNVYVVDRALHRVQKFTSTGTYITKWGSSGSTDGRFSSPAGIGVDSQGSIYVVDRSNHRIQKFTNTGTFLTKWGSLGSATTQLYWPTDIVVDGQNKMLVADSYNNRVVQLQYDATVSIDTLSLPDGKVADPYSTTIQVSGAEGTLNLSTTGTIPPGLVFNTSTAELSGTPTTEGDYTFTLFASDDYNTVSREYTVTIAPITPVRIITETLPDGAIGVNYSEPVEAQDVNGVASWSITAGALPTGLAINTADGTVNGTPTQPGIFTFTVRVEDDLSSDTKELTISVPALPAIQITTTSLPDGLVGTGYSSNIQTVNSSGTITFAQTLGALPGGLAISANTGVISGTPTREGTYTFTVRATDQYGSDSKELSILIKPATTTITAPSEPEAEDSSQTNNGADNATPGGIADSDTKRPSSQESVVPQDGQSRTALVIRNFPWLLILLLATLALQSVSEAIMQIYDTKKVRALVARQKLLNEEKKSLVSLASHYLRTPVTLITSGVEMMSDQSSAKTVLQNGVKKLQSTIESLIGKLESTDINNTLVSPGEPVKSRVSLWAPRVVWPLVGSLVFIALINLVAVFWQELSSTTLLIAAQVAIVLVIGALHLLAHNTYKRGSENYKYEKRLLTYQQQLDHLRNKFLREVNEELVPAVVSIDTHLVSGSAEKSAKYIKDGVSQLESTAQKFILISQLEEGAITQNATDINLHEAAQSAKDGLNNDERLVTIDIPHNATVHQPEFLMRTVLQSLLTNAAEHSKPDQAITVRARKHHKVTEISVADRGEGIPADKLVKLFKPLSRAESSEDFSHEGIGLSLYINQLIMHYLGGSISATSGSAKGTRVKIVVPNTSA